LFCSVNLQVGSFTRELELVYLA